VVLIVFYLLPFIFYLLLLPLAFCLSSHRSTL
jgi:hypothetical protein